MKFFQYQSLTPYQFDTSVVQIVDITQRARIAERLSQYTTAMYEYEILEEERPDIVANKLYGSVGYTWLVLLLNNIMSLYDWPLNTADFTAYIISKYGSIAAAESGTPIYFTVEGDRVDASTYTALPSARKGTVLTPYEFELQQNDAKRRIRVIRREFLPLIARTIQTLYT
jgi:hypothetical protein